MTMKQINKIPRFKNEDEERAFWSTHSPLDFLEDLEPVELQFPNLKPTTRTISIRLPEWMIVQLKTLANKKDIPYQSLVKVFLGEKIKEESVKVA
jgi:predicted DNA binding CopG/RHH family protein